ncbi:MAG: chorismate mutase [Bacteroidia bacterium]
MQFTPLEEWDMGLKAPLFIGGPCSAESPEQMDETLAGVANLPVQVFRAGIWKPRTRPNAFEGVGKKGLPWLKENGQKHNRPVTAEVANARHVEEALRHGIDILWIGARTTVNPFAVQAIADALEGVDVPVMVKNPVNPDLALWIGAIERLFHKGIHKIAAIHRGFSSYAPSKYRNNPRWEIPIELRRRHPDLPIICDPSHICGRRDLLAAVSQKAMDLDFDGLMIESHCNPDVALSDAKQQITPAVLGTLLANLVMRTPEGDNPASMTQLEQLREMIDELDHELLEVLGKRMSLSQEIGAFKRQNNVSILQTMRWNEIFNQRMENGTNQGLGEDFMLTFIQALHKESIRRQAMIMNPDERSNE